MDHDDAPGEPLQPLKEKAAALRTTIIIASQTKPCSFAP